ncbi:MAG: YihY/virulence factor BrkB family protein [Syntrophorhabdus sp.]
MIKEFLAPFSLLLRIIKDASIEWWADDSPRLAAAVAFYTVFSLAPMLIIAVAMAGAVFGQAAVKGEVISYVEGFTGREAANVLQGILASARTSQSGLAATASVVFLLVGATAVFAELQHALNRVWEVRSSAGFKSVIVTRLLSFIIVLGMGFLLIAALLANAALVLARSYVTIPIIEPLFFLLNFALPFSVITILFAMFYKILPDVKISWDDVWIGALITAILFVLGNYLLSLYLAHGVLTSAYGAAGSLVAFLLWIYYSTQIFLFGAEITHVWANRLGTKITPARGAVAVPQKKRMQSQ